MIGRALVVVVASFAATTASFAQPKQPIPPFVADVRITSAGLPTAEGWTPVVPAQTDVPGRAFGLDAGAHVFFARLRRLAFGVGATWVLARGTTSAPANQSPTMPLTPPIPDVRTRVASVAPQISLNFGHRLGWSYLSAGLGRTRVESNAMWSSGTPQPRVRDSGWVKTLNYGGGARWFVNDHVGVGFDLRWHKLSIVAATANDPGAPRASLLVAGAGVVVK